MLNISRQAYSNYETGNRSPDLETLVKLCNFYRLTLDEMVNGTLSIESTVGVGTKVLIAIPKEERS